MPKRNDIKTILVIGSGPITIGQAAEFDYAGTQACLSLREEGYEVILVNSNPATIMTDKINRIINNRLYINTNSLKSYLFYHKIHLDSRCKVTFLSLGQYFNTSIFSGWFLLFLLVR